MQQKWTTAEQGKRFNQFRRPKYLFSGLTKCGECGAGFIVYSRDQLGCFGARDRGTCTNTLTIARQEVEERVLGALQDKLMRQDFFEEFCREFAKEMNRLRMEQRAGLTSAERELERVEREIQKVIEAIKDGVPAPQREGRADRARERGRTSCWSSSTRAENRRRCCTRAWPTSTGRRSRTSPRRCSAKTPALEASEMLRGLIDAIVLTPEKGQLRIELRGNLAAMLTAAQKTKRSPETGDLLVPVQLVAGAGFEPATFGL